MQQDRAEQASMVQSLQKSLADTEKAVKKIEGTSQISTSGWRSQPTSRRRTMQVFGSRSFPFQLARSRRS